MKKLIYVFAAIVFTANFIKAQVRIINKKQNEVFLNLECITESCVYNYETIEIQDKQLENLINNFVLGLVKNDSIYTIENCKEEIDNEKNANNENELIDNNVDFKDHINLEDSLNEYDDKVFVGSHTKNFIIDFVSNSVFIINNYSIFFNGFSHSLVPYESYTLIYRIQNNKIEFIDFKDLFTDSFDIINLAFKSLQKSCDLINQVDDEPFDLFEARFFFSEKNFEEENNYEEDELNNYEEDEQSDQVENNIFDIKEQNFYLSNDYSINSDGISFDYYQYVNFAERHGLTITIPKEEILPYLKFNPWE